MTISGTDAYGAYIDTGVAIKPTARANTETDIHQLASGIVDVDTGSTLTSTQRATHITPARPVTSPR